MENMDVLIALAMALVGGLCGWALRSQRAVPERLRLVAHFEGRTRLAERDLELAQKELDQARFKLRRLQEAQGEQGTRIPELKNQLLELNGELARVRQELAAKELLLRRVGADDLSRLAGVGPVLAERLKELGITAFKDLAQLDQAGLASLAEKLNIPLRTIQRHDWPRRAAELLEQAGVSVP